MSDKSSGGLGMFLAIFVNEVMAINKTVGINIHPIQSMGSTVMDIQLYRYVGASVMHSSNRKNKKVCAQTLVSEREIPTFENIETIAKHGAKYLMRSLDEETTRVMDERRVS